MNNNNKDMISVFIWKCDVVHMENMKQHSFQDIRKQLTERKKIIFMIRF